MLPPQLTTLTLQIAGPPASRHGLQMPWLPGAQQRLAQLGAGMPHRQQKQGLHQTFYRPHDGPSGSTRLRHSLCQDLPLGSVLSGLTTALSIGSWEGSQICSPNLRALITWSYSKPCPGCQHTTGSPWPASMELAACGGHNMKLTAKCPRV